MDAGKYIGVEGDGDLLQAGVESELGRQLVQDKRPTLLEKTLPAPLPQADIVWIHALFDHIPPEDSQSTLKHAAAAAPRIFATFFLTDAPEQPKRWLRYGSEDGAVTTQQDREYWHHSPAFVTAAADDAGLSIAGWHDYGHPLSLTLVEFVRN